jgi:glutaredoxin
VKRVVVYTKEGCHLCERVISSLERMRQTEVFELLTADITKDPQLFLRFKEAIPVVEIDGEVRVAGAALSNPRTLDAVLQRALASCSAA